jgi:hypothetical protein
VSQSRGGRAYPTVGNPGALPRLRGRGEQGHIVSPVLCWSALCITIDFEDLDHNRILPVRCLRILAGYRIGKP